VAHEKCNELKMISANSMETMSSECRWLRVKEALFELKKPYVNLTG
jgi:hypothetical protein